MKHIDKCKLDNFATLDIQYKINLVVCSLMRCPVVNITTSEIKEKDYNQLHFFLMMVDI
jgi:hypothetical protein